MDEFGPLPCLLTDFAKRCGVSCATVRNWGRKGFVVLAKRKNRVFVEEGAPPVRPTEWANLVEKTGIRKGLYGIDGDLSVRVLVKAQEKIFRYSPARRDAMTVLEGLARLRDEFGLSS